MAKRFPSYVFARRFKQGLTGLALFGFLTLGAPLGWAQPTTVDPRITVATQASDHPAASSVLLLDDIRFDVRPDRTHIFDEHDAVKILTLEGLEENASLDRILDESEAQIEVLVARTVKADGRVVDAAPPELTPLVPESKLYSSIKRFSIRFPELEVGDAVEFRLRTIHKPKPGGHFWATTYVENPMPIADSSFTVTVPKDVHFQVATPGIEKGGEPKVESVTTDGVEYKRMSWKVSHQKAFEPRPLAPSTLGLLKRIEVSSFRSWEEVADYIGKQWASNSTLSEGLSLRVAGWLPVSNEAGVRAKAVLKELSHKRKTASFLADTPTFHRPSAVFGESIVSLPDASLLTSVALSAAGIPNIPVATLGKSRASLADEVPHPDKIDRIILQLPQSGGFRWVDPESPGFLLETPPSGASDTAAISWDARFAGGVKGLKDLEPGSALANREELAVEGRLERNGRAELSLQFDRYGGSALNARQAARDIGEGARGVRERALDSFFNNAALAYGERARLLGRFFENDPETKDPFSLAFTIAVPNFGVARGDVLTVPLPRFLSANIRAAALEKSRGAIPLRFDQPYQQDVRIHLIFPEGSKVLDAPARIEKKTPEAEFTATGRAEGNEVWYVGRLTVLDPWIEPKDLQSALSVLGSAIESEGTVLKVSLPTEAQAGGEGDDNDEG